MPTPMPISPRLLTNVWTTVDPWFGRSPCPIEVDLGCGKGGLALEMARRFPDRLVLASDVMLGRLRRVANKASRLHLGNLEILRASSLELVAFQLPASCIRRLHVICPDPWPKDRHRGRRLLGSDFLARAARVLEPGGILHLATDDPDYLAFIRAAIEPLPWYREDHSLSSIADIGDIRTEFELLWHRLGKTVPHLAFIRQ